jgi:YVTN family beta-propeller protein
MTLRRRLRATGAAAAALCLTAGMPPASASTVVQTIPVGSSPLGVSSDGTHVWVTNFQPHGTVTELDAATGTVIKTIPVGSFPFGVSSSGGPVWVANQDDDTVTELDAATGTVTQTIRVGRSPYGVSSDGTRVWITNEGDNTVSELDALTAQAISFTGPGTGTVGGQATLTATGGASGNPVTFTVDPASTPGACAVSGTEGTTLTYTGPGTCVINANQAAGSGFAAAPQAQQTVGWWR